MSDYTNFDWSDVNNEVVFGEEECFGSVTLSSDRCNTEHLAYIEIDDVNASVSLYEKDLEEFIGACQSLLTYIKKRNSGLNIFVAGPGGLLHTVRDVIEQVRADGHHVYDWTSSPGWEDPNRKNLSQEAINDARAIESADAILWVWREDWPSLGASYEAGLARGLGKPVVIYWPGFSTAHADPNNRQQLYTTAHLIYRDLECALLAIRGLVKSKKEASKS